MRHPHQTAKEAAVQRIARATVLDGPAAKLSGKISEVCTARMAVPTAASGVSDWADTVGESRRVGLVHAAANTAGLLCFASSW